MPKRKVKKVRKNRKTSFLTTDNRKDFEQRNRIIRSRYAKGYESMAEIGASFGITRQRVEQILRGDGV